MGASPAYRLRQGTRALFAFARPVDQERAADVLPPALMPLFLGLRRSEQQHSLRVLAAVREARSPALNVAALLHDAGKSRYPIRLWQRALPVVVGAVSQAWLLRLAQRDPRAAWSRGFVVYVQHAEWGAALAEAAGAPADAVWLIRHHSEPGNQWQTHPLYPLLALLKAADDAN